MKHSTEKREWKAEAILNKKKNSISIIEASSEKEMYFKILDIMSPNEYERINVIIKRA